MPLRKIEPIRVASVPLYKASQLHGKALAVAIRLARKHLECFIKERLRMILAKEIRRLGWFPVDIQIGGVLPGETFYCHSWVSGDSKRHDDTAGMVGEFNAMVRDESLIETADACGLEFTRYGGLWKGQSSENPSPQKDTERTFTKGDRVEVRFPWSDDKDWRPCTYVGRQQGSVGRILNFVEFANGQLAYSLDGDIRHVPRIGDTL